VLDINRPEFDVGQALSLRLGLSQDERRLGKVETAYLPGAANQVCRGERGGTSTATCVRDTVSGRRPMGSPDSYRSRLRARRSRVMAAVKLTSAAPRPEPVVAS
jgi:hypothetical protein